MPTVPIERGRGWSEAKPSAESPSSIALQQALKMPDEVYLMMAAASMHSAGRFETNPQAEATPQPPAVT